MILAPPCVFLSINTGEESRQKIGRKRGKKGRISGIEKKKRTKTESRTEKGRRKNDRDRDREGGKPTEQGGVDGRTKK